MSKNQHDFFFEGVRAAKGSKPKPPTSNSGKTEFPMPVFGEGKGWQNKAFADGFKLQVESAGGTVLYGQYKRAFASGAPAYCLK